MAGRTSSCSLGPATVRTNCRVVANNGPPWSSVFVQLHLDTRPVQNVRVRPDVDIIRVSPQHAAVTHRRSVLHVHPAHHSGGGGNERVHGCVRRLVEHGQQRLMAVVCRRHASGNGQTATRLKIQRTARAHAPARVRRHSGAGHWRREPHAVGWGGGCNAQ